MTDLTLSQIRSLKATMEQAIHRATEDAVTSFQRETGLDVTDIQVHLEVLGEQFHVTAVSAAVDPLL